LPNARKPDPERYYKFLEVRNDLDIQIAKIMADNKLDAIVHKTDEHTPTLLKDGINPRTTTSSASHPSIPSLSTPPR
jgi:hypothetical protein